MPRFSSEKIVGKQFVRTLDDDTSSKATILCKLQNHEAENHANIKFLAELGYGEFDEIITPYTKT